MTNFAERGVDTKSQFYANQREKKILKSSLDKNEDTYRGGDGGGEPLLSDSGFE